MARQMALPFPEADLYRAPDYLAGRANAEALAFLDHIADWPQSRLCVWGEEGSGKTHFAHVFAARTGGAVIPSCTLGYDCAAYFAPLAAPAIAIDDADHVADPLALLHLLNGAAEQGRPVLLTARTPPSLWPYALPDLVSRLRAMTSLYLAPPDDALLARLLRRLVAARQLQIDEALQAWLLQHLPREGAALRRAVARLDRESLAASRKLSKNFAAKILADMIGTDDAGAAPDAVTAPLLL